MENVKPEKLLTACAALGFVLLVLLVGVNVMARRAARAFDETVEAERSGYMVSGIFGDFVYNGDELTEYLLKYGYLGFENVELYGMNARQGLNSDLVTQTQYMHKYYPDTSSLIAIENQGEADYYLVDSDDNVYEYDTNIKQLRKTDLKLFEYIVRRFESVR